MIAEDSTLMHLIPEAQELPTWEEQEDLILLRDSAQLLAEGSGPPVQLGQCMDAMRREGHGDKPFMVMLEVESATEFDLSYREPLNYIRWLIKQGHIKRVWCQMSSRLSRRAEDGVILDHEASKSGAQYIYANNTGLSKLDKITKGIILYILHAMDELEAMNSRMKMTEGRKFKWKLNRMIGCSRAPFGHKFVDAVGQGRTKNGWLRPDPDTFPEVIRWYESVEMAGSDACLSEMARDLDLRSVPVPFQPKRKRKNGKPYSMKWHGSTIRRILLDPVNIGIVYGNKWRTVRREVEEGITKKIKRINIPVPEGEWLKLEGAAQRLPGLTNELFGQVREYLTNPRRTPAKLENEEDFPLNGHIICDECERPVFGFNWKPKPTLSYPRYKHGSVRETTHADKRDCPHRGFSAFGSKLDPLVWEDVRRFLADEHSMEKLIRNRQKVDLSPLLAEIENMRELVEQKKDEIREIAAAIPKQKGFLREQLELNGQQTQVQLDVLAKRLEKLEQQRGMMQSADDRILGLKEKLAGMRKVILILEDKVASGEASEGELFAYKRATYRALDLKVRVSSLPESMTALEKRHAMPVYKLTSTLGPLLSLVSDVAPDERGTDVMWAANLQVGLMIVWNGPKFDPVLFGSIAS
jgi:hypothetical protein